MIKTDRLKNPELILIVVLAGIVFGLILYFLHLQKPAQSNILWIGGVAVEVELANTQILRSKGLSDRENLESNKGMLFIFDTPEEQQFWMNRMLFPLDVIWIHDHKVVGTTENIPTPYGDTIPRMSSEVPVEWVLEVNAGFVREKGIEIGDGVTLKRN